jgi:hypothetical protein
MKKSQVMSQTTLLGDAQCKVIYNQRGDIVVLEVGGTSLKLDVCNFMMMNEMIRKAAARLVMQTNINY